MKISDRLKAGGTKLVSGAMSVVLAVGLVPLPAYADLQTASFTTQSTPTNGSMSTEGLVLGASMAAANPAPEILGLTNPIQRRDGEGETTYEFFGNDETNSNPDPYLWNYVHKGTPAFKSVGMASPMTGLANKPYGTDANGNWAWQQKPDIVLGTGSDSLPVSGVLPTTPYLVDEERSFYDSEAYARAAETANGWDSDSYHPIGVTYNRTTLPDMINTMYRLAQAADEVIANSNGKLAARYSGTNDTTGRYETVTDIAKEYERYSLGQKGAVLKAIEDKKVPMRTVAVIEGYDSSAGTYTLTTSGTQQGTAATDRYIEAVQGVAINYYDTIGPTATANDLKNVDLIVVKGNAGDDLTAVTTAISGLSAAGLLGKSFYATTWNNGSAFGLTVNSVENAQNVGRILPCLYPEVLDQSDMIAYYYDVFYHIKESQRNAMIASKMDGVRNWGGNDTTSYTSWSESDVSDYVYSETESLLARGVAYLNSKKGLGSYLQPSDFLANDSMDLSKATITFTTSGTADANPTISVKLGDLTLTAGTDYEADYAYGKDGRVVGAEGTVTVKAKQGSAYTGSKEASFTVVRSNFTSSTVKISSIASSYDYTGAAIEPVPTVTLATGMELTPGTDYSVSYSNNIGVGQATITVTGNGKYAGSVSQNFTIAKKTVSESDTVTVSISDQVYTGSAITPSLNSMIVRVNGVALPQTDYSLGSLSNNTAVGEATGTVTINSNNISGSANAKFKIIAKNIINAINKVDVAQVTYSGEELKPAITVTPEGNATLTEDTDYTVEYSNNIIGGEGVGIASLVGKGNYTGRYDARFTIGGKQLSNESVTISAIANQAYTGSEIKPPLTVKEGSTVLVEGADYTVAYSDNTAVSTQEKPAKATITFKGNYSGSAGTTFKIVAADTSKTFTDEAITVLFPEQTAEGDYTTTYTGKALAPTLTVKKGEATLSEGTDFVVEYSNNTNAGTATVKLTGLTNDNYGSFEKTFTIGKREIKSTDTDVEVTIDDQTWTGSEITPVVKSVKLGSGTDTVTVDSSAYTITAKNNKDVAASTAETAPTATLTFVGDNLVGSFDKKFTIAAVDLSAKDTATKVTVKDKTISGTTLATTDVTKDDIKVTAKVNGEEVTLKLGEDYDVTQLSKTTDISAGDKITATITGKKNYKETATGSFTIVKDLTSAGIAVINNLQYTGSAVVPASKDMSVYCDGVTDALVYGTDYTVACSDSGVGIATATITGKGKYSGSFKQGFSITPVDLSEATITVGGVTYLNAGVPTNAKYSTPYTGKAVMPGVKVKVGDVELAQDSGFYVYFDDNTAASDLASFSIYCDGVNATGNFDGYFTIARRSMAASSITATTSAKYAFAGSTAAPTFTVKDTDLNTTLKANTDYTVKAATAGKLAGTKVNVQVVGKGNYSAAKFASLTTVVPTITVNSGKDLTYTGKAQKPRVTVEDSVGNTIDASNYTVAYKNNTKAGTGTVTITGKGKYAGTATQTFTIAKAANPLKLKAAKVSFKYNKKNAQTIALTKYQSKAGQGTVTYSVSGQKKNNSKVKYFSVDKKGKVTMAKNTPKGTYKVTMSATASGNDNYNATAKAQTAVITVTVK